jgi:hypothetical protein
MQGSLLSMDMQRELEVYSRDDGIYMYAKGLKVLSGSCAASRLLCLNRLS